jgi:hypothetical protein
MSLESLLLRLSLILLFIMVSFLSASSISLDKVTNRRSDELDVAVGEAEEPMSAPGLLMPPPVPPLDIVIEGVELPYELVAKLLHSLLNATSFESISFSRWRACFRSAANSKKTSFQLRE